MYLVLTYKKKKKIITKEKKKGEREERKKERVKIAGEFYSEKIQTEALSKGR